MSLLRLKPNQYAHVLNNNTLITTVLVGPITYTTQQHEFISFGPAEMVNVPPRSYCTVLHPVVRSSEGLPINDENGQTKIKFGFKEIRFSSDPFPLYPGEELLVPPTPLTIVAQNSALRIRAIFDYTDEKGVKRITGDEWLFKGPGTYFPRVEEELLDKVDSFLIQINEAIVLKAKNSFVDSEGVRRIAGDKWLYRKPGSYLPDVYEEKIGIVKGIVITPTTAVHVVAKQPVVSFGKKHLSGEHWLVTFDETDMYIPEIEEIVVETVHITTLSPRQFCVVHDPVDKKTGIQRFGARELRKGETSFFLFPGESLEKGIEDVYVLGEEEALLLKAISDVKFEFVDKRSKVKDQKTTITKRPGERWLLYGPCEFIPQIEVAVIEKRISIPLGENEGVYVRNITNGSVRSVIGESYMLKENEELWNKELTAEMEKIVSSIGKQGKSGDGKRIPYHVISYQVPDNHAVQIFDYKSLKSRIVFGPELVLLEPDEHFTILNLSGGFPKQTSFYQTIALFLGPDFINDQIVVETCDHCVLSVKLSYSWRFLVNKSDPESSKKMFFSADFVGDVCRIIGSRVRGTVARTQFDTFHKNSADIVRSAIFGEGDEVVFESNNLVITGVDVQSAEPVDQSTRDSLSKSVQLAIEITTASQEAGAQHEAERIDQLSKSELERKGIEYEAKAEASKRGLLELQAANAAVESSGAAIGEAKAKAAAARIDGEAAVEQSRLLADSKKIEFEALFEEEKLRAGLVEDQIESMNKLEITKRTKEAAIEISKFKNTVEAITPETITAIAQAGPELQAKLLTGLGMQSMLITDGTTPINLFNTAQGLVGKKENDENENDQ